MVYYLRTNDYLCCNFVKTLLVLQYDLLIYDTARTEECHLGINDLSVTFLTLLPGGTGSSTDSHNFLVLVVFRLLHLFRVPSLSRSRCFRLRLVGPSAFRVNQKEFTRDIHFIALWHLCGWISPFVTFTLPQRRSGLFHPTHCVSTVFRAPHPSLAFLFLSFL